MNHKKHTVTASLAAVLAALIATTALMSGCGGNDNATPDEAAKETRVVSETQIVTKVVDGVYTDENGNVITDENGQPITAVVVGTDANGEPIYDDGTGSNTSNGSGSSSGNNSGSAQSSNSGGSDNSSSGGSGSSSGSDNSSSAQSSDSGNSSSSNSGGSGGSGGSSQTLTIDGKSYKVGDTVTCTYQLTSKKLLMNFQAQINYDGKCLKATNAYFDGPAKSGSILNYDLDSKIKFNGINLNGYNYTKTTNFFIVEYEVLSGGSTKPEFVWQIATDTKDNALVNNGTPDSSLVISESFS